MSARDRLVNDSTDHDRDTSNISPEAPLFDNASSPQQTRQRPAYTRVTSFSPEGQTYARFADLHDGDIGTSAEHSDSLGISENHERNRSLGSEPSFYDEERDQFVSSASVRSVPFSFASSTQPLNGRSRSAHKVKTSDHDQSMGNGSIRSRKAYAEFSAHMYCPSREHIWKGAGHYIYITLLVLGVFSTIVTGFYLGIAIVRPRYGKFISDDGNLTYSNAVLVFALFAKLAEMSFITVFVAFIGQVLSRRAFNRSKGHGVTLAEISMRGWVMQPGQMLTRPDAVKHVIRSTMGIMALCAAITAMLYTTAASALVTPQLSPGKFSDLNLQGLASRSFGDTNSIKGSCGSPVQNDDYDTKQSTCMGPSFAASSNNDWSSWLQQWTVFANTTNGSNDLRYRPPAYSLISDNTTVTAPWIEIQNMTQMSNKFSRIINNVSLAMPHTAVIDAAFNPKNHVLQPKLNDGFGSYGIHASVPSPAINVLCAEMSEAELTPLIYQQWPHANKSLDFANWDNKYALDPAYVPKYGSNEWLNSTVVDDVFGFGPSYGQRRPPVFPRLPIVYNTIVNTTGAYAPFRYRDAVYVLGGNPNATQHLTSYSLCSLRAYRTPNCSTWFNATSSSSRMSAVCEQPDDRHQFAKTADPREIKSGNETTSIYWVDMADVWLEAISLGSGITDANAANPRLLTQFFPTSRELNPKMPSMAEALAVMAGHTLLEGARNSPLRTMTDDAEPSTNVTQTVKSAIQSQQYGSGATQPYQNAFFIVLFAVFFGNILVLAWLIANRGLVTDFADPANMFSLSINSPPSHIFAGSCGGGPSGKQYDAKWFINIDGDHVYIENDALEHELAENRLKSRPTFDDSAAPSPIMQTYSRLSKRKSIL